MFLRPCSILVFFILIIGISWVLIEALQSFEESRVDRLEEPTRQSWVTSLQYTAPRTPIMTPMGNETLRAELGRASWRLLHTMTGKFPEKPTPEQSKSLQTFIYLFAELYPCGDCAQHFQKILARHPPDTRSREAASQWACKVHNLVNERLLKPQFDCSKVQDTWKCGCAEDEKT